MTEIAFFAASPKSSKVGKKSMNNKFNFSSDHNSILILIFRGGQKNHSQVRDKVIRHLSTNKELFEGFITKDEPMTTATGKVTVADFDQYLKVM